MSAVTGHVWCGAAVPTPGLGGEWEAPSLAPARRRWGGRERGDPWGAPEAPTARRELEEEGVGVDPGRRAPRVAPAGPAGSAGLRAAGRPPLPARGARPDPDRWGGGAGGGSSGPESPPSSDDDEAGAEVPPPPALPPRPVLLLRRAGPERSSYPLSHFGLPRTAHPAPPLAPAPAARHRPPADAPHDGHCAPRPDLGRQCRACWALERQLSTEGAPDALRPGDWAGGTEAGAGGRSSPARATAGSARSTPPRYADIVRSWGDTVRVAPRGRAERLRAERRGLRDAREARRRDRARRRRQRAEMAAAATAGATRAAPGADEAAGAAVVGSPRRAASGDDPASLMAAVRARIGTDAAVAATRRRDAAAAARRAAVPLPLVEGGVRAPRWPPRSGPEAPLRGALARALGALGPGPAPGGDGDASGVVRAYRTSFLSSYNAGRATAGTEAARAGGTPRTPPRVGAGAGPAEPAPRLAERTPTSRAAAAAAAAASLRRAVAEAEAEVRAAQEARRGGGGGRRRRPFGRVGVTLRLVC